MPSHTWIPRQLVSAIPDDIFVKLIDVVYRRFENELRVIDEIVPRGGTAIDVGVWYGPWSRALAARAHTVASFEPNPAVHATLEKTLPANVTLYKVAIGDNKGTATLFSPTEKGTEGVASLHGEGDGVPVEVAPLDQYEFTDVRFLKIDVEGHELPALRGAEKTITTQRPVIMLELEYSMSDVDNVLNLMSSWGYAGRYYADGAWQPLNGLDLRAHQAEHSTAHQGKSLLQQALSNDRYINNIVFSPQESGR